MRAMIVRAVLLLSLGVGTLACKGDAPTTEPTTREPATSPPATSPPAIAPRPTRPQRVAKVPLGGGSSEIPGIVAAHNAERKRVGVAALAWSDRLAAHAQKWAEHLASRGCGLQHRPGNDAYGENLYWSSAASSAAAVVASWASEQVDYDRRTNTCRGVCGHYTQIVWRSTRSVGCGRARCGSSELWVCNYDPPGNFVGERPF
jgi:uncharacterized protein YkwD